MTKDEEFRFEKKLIVESIGLRKLFQNKEFFVMILEGSLGGWGGYG